MAHSHSQSQGWQGHHDHHAHMIQDFKKRFWISLVLTLPILAMAPLIQDFLGYTFEFPGDGYVQFVLSSLIYFSGGWPFLKGMVSEIQDRSPGMMTLIALAITVAYVYSSAVVFGLEGKTFFWELASLIAIMLLGHWIEMRSVMGASRSMQELANLMPATAHRVEEQGETIEIPLDKIQGGDLLLIRAGEKIPADGEIEEGESRVNESMLTGESVPVGKKAGDPVIGGSINENGVLQVRVQHTGEEAYISKVIRMVTEAQESKSKTQNLADKAAGWLFYLALGAGLITLIVWLSLGEDFVSALERMVTVMIIACPHALGLAIPLVVANSTSVSAREGLLIRNRTAFEQTRKVDTLIFDKTGTLTTGEFGLSRIVSTSDHAEKDILKRAAALEARSEHPIASGILKKAEEEGIDIPKANSIENITGKGISGQLHGKTLHIVSPGYLEENKLEIPEDAFQDKSETVVFLLEEGQLAGYFALSDQIREESAEAVKTLKENGIKVLMATGDNEQVARSVAEKLSLDGYFAEVLPEEKQEIIKDLQEKGNWVAMTGDGVNDAPALAQANIGIAVGSGTDVAAETADIILVNSNPRDILKLILFGTATHQKMIQNLIWAVGYNVVAIPLAAGVLYRWGITISPALGAVLMSLSTVIVALNALWLKKQLEDL